MKIKIKILRTPEEAKTYRPALTPRERKARHLNISYFEAALITVAQWYGNKTNDNVEYRFSL